MVNMRATALLIVCTITLGFLCGAAGSTNLFNNTGVAALGLQVTFDQPVSISRMGEGFRNWSPEGDGSTIVFFEGQIGPWGDFYFFWEPVEASVLSYEWLGHPSSAERSPSFTTDSGLLSGHLGSEEYRGMVVLLEYAGPSADLEKGASRVDFYQAEDYVHSAVPAIVEPGVLEVEIVDAMFEPSEPIRGELHFGGEQAVICFTVFFDSFSPWIDWMLGPGDEKSLRDFRYDWPDCPNGLGAHSSWDFDTRGASPVYSGTDGEVFFLLDEGELRAVYIYNRHTGLILQYGHVHPARDLKEGMSVQAGDLIGDVDTVYAKWPHIHFSVIRPLGWHDNGDPFWWEADRSRNVFDPFYYKNPIYFHEPTTWGYWNEGTLPEGWAALMKKYFQRHNSGITAPINKRNVGNQTKHTPQIIPGEGILTFTEAFDSVSEAGELLWKGPIKANEEKEITIYIYDAAYLMFGTTVRFLVQHEDTSALGSIIQGYSTKKEAGCKGGPRFGSRYCFFEEAQIPVVRRNGDWIGTIVIVPETSVVAFGVCKAVEINRPWFGLQRVKHNP